MKNLLLISFFLLLSLQGWGQEAAISLIKQRVLYWNFDNPVELAVCNYPCKKVFIKAKRAKIIKLDSCKYIINPEFGVPSEVFEIFTYTKNDTLLVDTIAFEFKRIPAPVVALAKWPNEKSVFMPNRIVASTPDNFYYQIKYKVISSQVLLYRRHKLIDSLHIQGDVLGDDFVAMGKKAKADDHVLFDKIQVQREDGNIEYAQQMLWHSWRKDKYHNKNGKTKNRFRK